MHSVERRHAKERARGVLFRGLDKPIELGRYRLGKKLGAGGMGVVFEAEDSSLQRKVAIKLMFDAGGSALAMARFRREARAMAALSHPNIVQVFEVGSQDGHLYIVMELVEGTTLAEKISDGLDFETALSLFRQAGAGLAAAHDAKLIHRDFKPANVLVGADGRARVADFGLVAGEDGEDVSTDKAIPQVGLEAADAERTKTGAVVGTMAYLAPELLDGREADVQSDQFSFCIALWEAIYGERPYKPSLLDLEAVRIGTFPIPNAPYRMGVPHRLRQALDRGLSVDPDKRFADMRALLRQLRSRSKRSWVAGGMAVAIVGGVALAAELPEAGEPDCEVASFDDVWDPAAASKVRATAEAAAPWGEQAAGRITTALDRYADSWEATAATVCAGREGTAQMEAGLACLRRGRAEVVDLLSELSEATAAQLVDVDATLSNLSSPQRCGSVHVPSVPLHPELRAEVEGTREELARLRRAVVRRETGLRPQLKAQASVPAARRFAPLALEIELVWGQLDLVEGEHAGAIARLTPAYWEALALNRQDVAIEAALILCEAHFDIGELPTAEEWRRHGRTTLDSHPDSPARLVRQASMLEAAITGANGDRKTAVLMFERIVSELPEVVPPSERVMLLKALGSSYNVAGRYDEASKTYATATDVAIAWLGDQHPHVGDLLAAHAKVLGRKPDHEGELALLERSIEILELAPLNPALRKSLARALASRAAVFAGFGRHDESVRDGERSLALTEQDLGSDNRSVADSLVSLSLAYDYAGRPDDCRRALLRAQTIYVDRLGARHPNVLIVANHLATLDHSQERYDDAIARLRETLQIRKEIFGEDDSRVAYCHTLIGNSLEAQARTVEAIAEFDRAIEIYERAGTRSAALSDARNGKAGALFGSGRYMEAATSARQTLAEIDSRGNSPITRGVANYLLARSLYKLGTNAAERDEAARAALEHYSKFRGGTDETKLQRLNAILDQSRPATNGMAVAE